MKVKDLIYILSKYSPDEEVIVFSEDADTNKE